MSQDILMYLYSLGSHVYLSVSQTVVNQVKRS